MSSQRFTRTIGLHRVRTPFVTAMIAVISILLSSLPAAPTLASTGDVMMLAPPDQAAQAKIDRQVLDRISAGGESDYFIWMVGQADLSAADQLQTKREKGFYVFDTLRATADRSQKGIRAELDARGIRYQSFYIANKIYVFAGDMTTTLALAARPDVAKITPNRQYQLPEPIKTPKSTTRTAGVEPNLAFIQADAVWNEGIHGEGTVLAGNDTGLQWDHPAIINQYRGWNGTTANHNYSWWDATGTYPNAPGDGDGHGTHTTGTMVGDDRGENRVGVAPRAQTIHCKNMSDSGYGDDYTFTTCFQWDLAPWDLTGNNPRPDLAPDAVNNSWGYWGGADPEFREEINALLAAGIVVGVSAGNEGPFCRSLRSPADYAQVLTIGSVSYTGGSLPGYISGFSSRGPSWLDGGAFFPDVMAPGEHIRSSVPGNAYASDWSGTSMAGPHVIGLIGLMWSANPALRGLVQTTTELIIQSTVPLSNQPGSNCGGDYITGPNHDWGYGTINAATAVQAAIEFGDTGIVTGTVTNRTNSQPLADATVEIAGNGRVFRTVTDAAGQFTRRVPVGVYAVTAQRYGFLPMTADTVNVALDQTTTQNFALDPAPVYTVNGRITDRATGWPLYASITIAGYPGEPVWTDPLTGAFQVELAGNVAYTFRTEAWVDGYMADQQNVGPLTANINFNVALDADPQTCIAPGYTQQRIWSQDFETTPDHFTVSGFSSWQRGVPTSGPGVAHSGANVWATNLLGNYMDYEDGYLVSPPINLSAYGDRPFYLRWWEWVRIERYYDVAVVEVSANGGATWETVRIHDGVDAPEWTQRTVALSAAYATANFRVRFRFSSDGSITYPGWYIDDLEIAAAVCQPPTNGGLVVGNVRDENTGNGLNGAAVRNEADYATISTNAGGLAGDGFYTLFAPAGAIRFDVTLAQYAAESSTVSVLANRTVRQDFALKTGHPEVDPAALSIVLPMGERGSLPLTVRNLGNGAFSFDFLKQAPSFEPAAGWATSDSLRASGLLLSGRFSGRFDQPDIQVDPARSNQPTTEGLDLPEPDQPLHILAKGDVLQTWAPAGNPTPWGIAVTPSGSVWVGEGWGADHVDEYSQTGAPTGIAHDYPWQPVYGPADFAFSTRTNTFWVVDVDADNCIHEIDPINGATGATICPAWNTSQRGLAYDPDTNTFWSGSWNDRLLHRFATDGTLLESVFTGLRIAGLAYNPDTKHLFVIENRAPTTIQVLDVEDNYAQLASFAIPDFANYGGAGLDFDCKGNLWAVDFARKVVVQLKSGEATTWCARGVPWLTATPISGTVAAQSETTVTVTFDASLLDVDQPGDYRARLVLATDTPYSNTVAVAAHMQVTAPATWGKVQGEITSRGVCDIEPAPLANAEVVLRGSSGALSLVHTDEAGMYSRWLDAADAPYRVTAWAENHVAEEMENVQVIPADSVTADLALRVASPCLITEPPAAIQPVQFGGTASTSITLRNTGAVTSEFSITNLNQGRQIAAKSQQSEAHAAGQVRIVLEEKNAQPQEDPPIFNLSSGGPDAFGYTFVDSSEVDGPEYAWIEIAPPAGGDGVLIATLNNVDDGYFFPLTLPFAFNFYGVDYQQLAVSSNGLLYFEDAYTSYYNQPIPSTTYGVARFLAPLWDDLIVSPGSIYYKDLGDRFVIEYYQLSACCLSPAAATWQAILYENGNILFQYKNMNFGDARSNGASATVGIQENSSTGLQYSYNAAVLTDDLAICFAHPAAPSNCSTAAPWLTTSPATGVLAAGAQTTIDLGFDAARPEVDQPGDYRAQLRIRSGGVDRPTPVAVTMRVAPPQTWGKVSGSVRSLGACSANPTLLSKVPVMVTGSSGFSQTIRTDADGVYALWMDVMYAPFTVAVSVAEHEPQQVSNITMAAGGNAVNNFDLLWLHPCMTSETERVDVVLGMTDSETRTIRIRNGGAVEGRFTIRKIHSSAVADAPPSYVSSDRYDTPDYQVDAAQTHQATAQGLMLPVRSPANLLAAGDIIKSWAATNNPAPWGIAYTSDDVIWVGDGWFSNHMDAYTTDGAPIGRSHTYTWSPGYGPADFTYNSNTNKIWVVDVGMDNCLHEVDPDSGVTGATICPAWSTSQRGVAYDPINEHYFTGSWNDGIVHRIDSTGAILESVFTGVAVAGLAYNPDTGHLFAIESNFTTVIWVFDTANNYNVVGMFSPNDFPSFSGAGLEIDCDGKLWAVNQMNRTVYQIESGETTSWCSTDIAWITVEPITGTLPAGGEATITLGFTAEGQAPGAHLAYLGLSSNDSEVPIEMITVSLFVDVPEIIYLPILTR